MLAPFVPLSIRNVSGVRSLCQLVYWSGLEKRLIILAPSLVLLPFLVHLHLVLIGRASLILSWARLWSLLVVPVSP